MRTIPHHSFAPPRKRTEHRRFTLVELIAAAVLLAVVAGILIRFYANLQVAYRESLRVATMGQDARAVFSLLDRDLRLATTRTDDIPGHDIRFHQADSDEIWFVSANDSGTASLVEVGYRLNGTTLERAEVDDRDSSWSPYGDRDDASTQTGYQAVVDRVVDLRFRCYDQVLAGFVPDQSSTLPAMVGIEITLLDPKSFTRWEALGTTQRVTYAAQKGRTFCKTVQIPAAQFAEQ